MFVLIDHLVVFEYLHHGCPESGISMLMIEEYLITAPARHMFGHVNESSRVVLQLEA